MRIILFGSTGMLGNYIKRTLLYNKYDLKCITREDYDICNEDYDKLLTLLHGYDIIINCAGAIPQRNDIYSERNYFITLNILFPQILSRMCDVNGIKLIHITTDCVYDGKKGKYTETDKHTDYGLYGLTKSVGEPTDCCVLRTSIIGEEKNNKKSLIEWLKSKEKSIINGYSNHYWNGVTCYQLSKIILNIIETDGYWNGIRHIFSPNFKSKLDICEIINSIYDLNIKINQHCTEISVDRTLSTIYKDNVLKFNIPDIRTQIIEQKEFGY